MLLRPSLCPPPSPLTPAKPSVLWRDNNRVVVFPPMGSFPVMGFKAKTDFLAWVGSGEFLLAPAASDEFRLMHFAGNCVVFLGDYKNVQFMNDLFGFTLQTSCAPPPLSSIPYLTPRSLAATRRALTTKTTATRQARPSSPGRPSSRSLDLLALCTPPPLVAASLLSCVNLRVA